MSIPVLGMASFMNPLNQFSYDVVHAYVDPRINGSLCVIARVLRLTESANACVCLSLSLLFLYGEVTHHAS